MAREANDIRGIGEERCCGCGVCVNACPADAISMREGKETFLFPVIEESLCVHCGKCLRACPARPDAPEGHRGGTSDSCGERLADSLCFAAAAPDEIRLSSSSGGIFPVLAGRILARGGVVYGAAWGEDGVTVEHIRVTRAEDLPRLSGSKYVPSRTGQIYRSVRADLKEGRSVLFSGTPCQNAGLLRFLNREYENLLTVDLVCHGVPSEALFHAYLEETYGRGQVRKICFRTKEFGQNCSRGLVFLKNGKRKVITAAEDPYERGFHRSLFLRKSCASCPFAPLPRAADLTLGDFWGLEKHSPQLADERGVSLVLIHTGKGKAVWEEVRGRLALCREMPLQTAIRYNRFRKNIRVCGGRSRFFALLPSLGFTRAVRSALDNRYDVMLAWKGSQDREKLETQLEEMAARLGRTVCLEGKEEASWECRAEGLEAILRGRYPEELKDTERKALERLLRTSPGPWKRAMAAAEGMGARAARILLRRLGPEKKEAIKKLFGHGK